MIEEVTKRSSVLTKQSTDVLEYVDFFRLDACRRQTKERQEELGHSYHVG